MVDIKKNKKLVNFIFDRMFEELSTKTYYPYGREIWVIDFETKEWYLQFNSNGVLCYNRSFFDSFFRIFSMSQSEYQKLLKFWFETNLTHSVSQISRRNLQIDYYIDGMKRSDNKKWSLSERYGFSYEIVKKFLRIKKNISENDIKLEFFMQKNEVC